MAGIDSQLIREFCSNLNQEIKRIYPFIDCHFIVYDNGMRAEEIKKILPALRDHPAFEHATSLIRFKSAALNHSAYVGIAEGFEKKNFSFKKTPKHLAFFTVNISDHETEDDLIFTIYKIISQLFDALEGHQPPVQNNPDKSDQLLSTTVANARINLRADLFNILHLSIEGDKNSVKQRAQIRALNALNPSSRQRPDEFAFPIALDVVHYALEKKISALKKSTTALLDAYKLSQDIMGSFDNESMRTWSQFIIPCQTLAWSGYSPSQILGAATTSSPNPYIKALGNLLSEITQISPCGPKQIPQGYNPFVDNEINRIEHRRSVEETFEMVMIHCMEADSHLPFLRVANNQNEALLKGHISGWCAHALQSAARAYAGAHALGVPAHQAARLEFEMYRRNDGWNPLLILSQHIVEMCRNGNEIKTLSAIAKWCGINPDLKFIRDSINATISDPNYSAKTQVAIEIPVVATLAPAAELIRSLSSRNNAPDYTPNTMIGNKISLENVQTKILLDD